MAQADRYESDRVSPGQLLYSDGLHHAIRQGSPSPNLSQLGGGGGAGSIIKITHRQRSQLGVTLYSE